MPLDRIKGEVIDGLGHKYRVVPNGKWRDSQLFEEAAGRAARAFLKSGALWPVTFDDMEVITQEYPADHKIAIVFLKQVRGKETLYPWVWELPMPMVKELKALGKWDDTAIN